LEREHTDLAGKSAELERRAEDRKWWQELKSWNQKSYTGFSADYWTMMMNWGKFLVKAESQEYATCMRSCVDKSGERRA